MVQTRRRIAGEMLVRFAAWVVLVIVQVCVIGMSLSAWYPHERSADASPVEARLWALALPVFFLASVATLLWRNPPDALAAVGRIYLLVAGLIVTLFTGGLLFG